jgi:Alternative oxidase
VGHECRNAASASIFDAQVSIFLDMTSLPPRRHLLTFMTLRQPGALFRLMVLLGQVRSETPASCILFPASCSCQHLPVGGMAVTSQLPMDHYARRAAAETEVSTLPQGIFFNMYFVTYLLAPKYCHSFVGYLEVGAHVYVPLCHAPGTELPSDAV